MELLGYSGRFERQFQIFTAVVQQSHHATQVLVRLLLKRRLSTCDNIRFQLFGQVSLVVFDWILLENPIEKTPAYERANGGLRRVQRVCTTPHTNFPTSRRQWCFCRHRANGNAYL